jgi:hypothetical protein
MGGRFSVIILWLVFGDHPVAGFRRSRIGRIAAIINRKMRPQKFIQEGLSLAGVLVLDRHCQCLPGSDEYGEFLGPGQSGVDQALKAHDY